MPNAWTSWFAAQTRRETVRDLMLEVDRARQCLAWTAVMMLMIAALGCALAVDHYAPALRLLRILAPDAPATAAGRTGTARELLDEIRLTITFAWLVPLLHATQFAWLRRLAQRAPLPALDAAIATFVAVHVSAAIYAPMTLMPPLLLLLRIGLLFALVGGRIAAAALRQAGHSSAA